MKAPDASEEQIHRALVEWLRVMVPEPPLGPTWFHPYNGGWRSKTEAGVGKALGVKAGVPDLIFLWYGVDRAPFAVEVKRRTGQLSDAQRDLIPLLEKAGVRVHIARSVEDLEAALLREGVPIRGHASACRPGVDGVL